MAGEFTTGQKIHDWLKITTAYADMSVAEKGIIDGLATSVQDAMEREMGRKIYTAAYTERYNGHGGTELTLKQSPITAVTTLKIDEAVIPAAANSNSSGYMFNDDTISLMQGMNSQYIPGFAASRFARGNRNIYVVYTAGYSTVPTDLQLAAMEQAAYEYVSRQRIGQKSTTVQQQTISFNTEPFLPGVQRTLNRYKRFTRSY